MPEDTDSRDTLATTDLNEVDDYLTFWQQLHLATHPQPSDDEQSTTESED